MKLVTFTSLLLLSAAFVTPVSADQPTAVTVKAVSEQGSTERLTASQPAIYDLGHTTAVIFYYTNSAGERLLVTTIAPKDPDSGETATQQIIKMEADGEYLINIAGNTKDSESMKLSAYFEGKDLIVAFNKV